MISQVMVDEPRLQEQLTAVALETDAANRPGSDYDDVITVITVSDDDDDTDFPSAGICTSLFRHWIDKKS